MREVLRKSRTHQLAALVDQPIEGDLRTPYRAIAYMETQEGKNLPVPHCIKGTDGWQIRPELDALRKTRPVDKPGFGSVELGRMLLDMNAEEAIGSVTLVGLCTDVCVISNALIIKAFLPEVPVKVDAACCAGISPESHGNALSAMAMCQVEILNGQKEA